MTETSDSYTCAACGGFFTKGWSDEEAAAEAESLIPAGQLDGGAEVVCNACWRGIMGRVQIEAPELLVPGARVAGVCHRTDGGLPVHIKPGCRCPR